LLGSTRAVLLAPQSGWRPYQREALRSRRVRVEPPPLVRRPCQQEPAWRPREREALLAPLELPWLLELRPSQLPRRLGTY
jgi:hypothetical protein